MPRSPALVNEVGLDRYRFGHALVRATLLEELTTSRRVRTHRKIGEAIEAQHAADLDAVVTDLAHHFGEAAAADPEKAIEYATRAGVQALRLSAPDDAVRWYTLAPSISTRRRCRDPSRAAHPARAGPVALAAP